MVYEDDIVRKVLVSDSEWTLSEWRNPIDFKRVLTLTSVDSSVTSSTDERNPIDFAICGTLCSVDKRRKEEKGLACQSRQE